MKKLYIIEMCNYEDYPTGGHLSFAKQLISAFGPQIYLIGVSTGNEPVKRWVKKEINGVSYNFFSVRKVKKRSEKPLIPNRLKYFYYISRCRKKLKFLKHENVFMQTPEVLLATRNCGIKNVCFRSPGVVNMLVSSRFWYAKYFKGLYESYMFTCLKKVNTILASADKQSIIEFSKRSKGKISNDQVIQFPTRIDTRIFRPGNDIEARKKLNLDLSKTVIVTTGRLGWLKGWKFMIDCFEAFLKDNPNSVFYFLGDGEDYLKVEKYLKEKNLTEKIFLTGRVPPGKIALYLNACDLYIMGSFIEGWSTSLVEAIACGKPICTTNFSSAKELVSDGFNGFVVESRDGVEFVTKMNMALKLPKNALMERADMIKTYSVQSLKSGLMSLWNLNAPGERCRDRLII